MVLEMYSCVTTGLKLLYSVNKATSVSGRTVGTIVRCFTACYTQKLRILTLEYKFLISKL
jgi:hypothetical protein